MASVKFADVADLAKHSKHIAPMIRWLTTITTKATDDLRPHYGSVYGFDVSMRANADTIATPMVVVPLAEGPRVCGGE